jgi:stage II sporulation protein P
MKRHKKRKITGILRVCTLLLLPSLIAASASCIRGIDRDKADHEQITEAAPASAKGIVHDTTREIKLPEKRPEDELYGSVILSEGYGYSTEDEAPDELSVLTSPLEMTADDPGSKPYPTQWEESGDIIRTTYQKYTGNAFFDLEKAGQVNNKTEIPNDELRAESVCLPNFTISDTTEPQVLIYHTHTCESFEPFVREHYDASFNFRTTDATKSVVMVGDAIQTELEAQGIGVIHVRTIHADPSYTGAYDRSRVSILPILEQYPSIKVALDIHRDAISGEGVAYQPYTEVNGREAAQVMIISGCDDGTMGMPEYMKNFHFACALQQQLESDTPHLTRPILFDYRKYNQDLTTGSLLIEVGSHGNTLEQVQYSGQLIGHSLGRLLNSMIKEKK